MGIPLASRLPPPPQLSSCPSSSTARITTTATTSRPIHQQEKHQQQQQQQQQKEQEQEQQEIPFAPPPPTFTLYAPTVHPPLSSPSSNRLSYIVSLLETQHATKLSNALLATDGRGVYSSKRLTLENDYGTFQVFDQHNKDQKWMVTLKRVCYSV